MPKTLPESANLDWLKKTAKQQLRVWKSQGREAKLADAQLTLAREYGFSSWRAMKSALEATAAASQAAADDGDAATFLRLVGDGRIDDVRHRLDTQPALVNAVGPHPFWGGSPQSLHVAIETKQRDMFDLLLDAGADVNGDNRLYDHWSPVMLTVSRDRPDMRARLIERGARIGLWEALLLADDDTVDAILRNNPDVLSRPRPSGSPLGLARTPFAIDRLLDLGAVPEEKDRWGSSAIETLSRLGPRGRPLVLHMQERGVRARPEEYARLGDMQTLVALSRSDSRILRSPAVVMAAVDFGHHDIVTWLLENGASANARSTALSKNTALHSAAWNGDLKMAELLIAHGADVAARDEEHDTTPAVWAEVSVQVSNNPKCADVAAYLDGIAADTGG